MGLIWGILISLFGVIATILIAAAARLVADDAKEWLPWVTRHLIERAVNRLPRDERERLEEEWWSHVNEMPGNLTKIYVAYGYLSASTSIGNIVRSGESLAIVERTQEAVWRAIDVVAAAALLTFFAPLFIAVALCIKLETTGPVFHQLDRVGRNGHVFKILKFRTMHRRPDPAASAANKMSDPQVTRVGLILRRCNVDELPQLINVLRGDMTFVGPRPLPRLDASEFAALDAEVPGFRERMRVKLGVTGWAQVNQDGSPINISDAFKKRIGYDGYYVKHRSLRFDLRILSLTFARVIRELFR